MTECIRCPTVPLLITLIKLYRVLKHFTYNINGFQGAAKIVTQHLKCDYSVTPEY